MKEIPLCFASTQPAKNAVLATAPASTNKRRGYMRTSTPQPICATARAVNTRTAWWCSPCAPIAAAWMAPAPIDANAPTASSGVTERLELAGVLASASDSSLYMIPPGGDFP